MCEQIEQASESAEGVNSPCTGHPSVHVHDAHSVSRVADAATICSPVDGLKNSSSYAPQLDCRYEPSLEKSKCVMYEWCAVQRPRSVNLTTTTGNTTVTAAQTHDNKEKDQTKERRGRLRRGGIRRGGGGRRRRRSKHHR
jgi:hypothetical protein